MIFFHTYSHSFLLFLSFIPFLSLSLIFTLHLIVPAFLVSLLSTVHLSRSLSLSFSLSFYLVSRLTLYLRPAFSLSFIPSLSVRSSQPPPLEFSPFQLPSSPTLSVYTFARFASPAGHPQSSISLSHAHSFSLRLSLSHRFTGVRFAYPLSVSHSLSLSLSPSCFEHRRSTFFLAVCPPSPSRVHPIWDSPKRARGGSAHHRLIHDYYHLICPAALFIVRAGEIAGQRRILSLETFWPGDLEQIGSRISADSGSGRRAR